MDIDKWVKIHHQQELIVNQWLKRFGHHDLDVPDFTDFLVPQYCTEPRLIVDYDEINACYASYQNFHH